MDNLTKEQLAKVISRQFWLEKDILGPDLDGEMYIIWSQGGQEEFYAKQLWDWLGMSEFASHNSKDAPDILDIDTDDKIFGEANKDNGR